MTRDVMAQVAMHNMMESVWTTVEVIFFSRTKVRAMNMHIVLATTHKGNLTMAEHIAKMKTFINKMATMGKP